MEDIILSSLVHNENYVRKVLPYLKDDYFSEGNAVVFRFIFDHVNKYNQLPTSKILHIHLEDKTDLSQIQYENAKEIIQGLSSSKYDSSNFDWLVDQTEKFCQEKALYNAIKQSIRVIDGKSPLTKGGLPELFQNALAVTFDNTVGHDFIEDGDSRYDEYTKVEHRIPFDIDLINTIFKGGLSKKALYTFMSPTGGGKTLVMCHCAAYNLISSKNVLYITLEMAEERIAQRIDSNLMNVSLDEIEILPKKTYLDKLDKIKQTTKGKLIIKEYPTASVGTNHFRHLFNELKLKKNFIPDVVYIDYINLCISSRFKQNASINSYNYIKAIAEELRGLAVEFKVPIVTATQTNRGAYGSSDFDLEDTSDSIGLAFTVDAMIGIIVTPELNEQGQIMFKQLKNRFGDINKNNRFLVGIDRSKMRLYNVEDHAQAGLYQPESSVFDKSSFGEADTERNKKRPKKSKILFDDTNFEGFN